MSIQEIQVTVHGSQFTVHGNYNSRHYNSKLKLAVI